MLWEERWHPLREEWVIVARRIGRTGRGAARQWAINKRKSQNMWPTATSVRGICGSAARRTTDTATLSCSTTIILALTCPRLPIWPFHRGFYRNRPANGIARVVCYSPKHNLSLAEIELSGVEKLLQVWQAEYVDLGNRHEVSHVLIFENKGEVVGVSHPHPHCQIYATNFVFRTIEIEAAASRRHFAETGRFLFEDILSAEQLDGRRIICESESAIAFVPYFARYAYEVYVAPKRTYPSFGRRAGQRVARVRPGAAPVGHKVRQPLADAISLCHAPASGADR